MKGETIYQTGFTLIELAIVLFILGLLLASILPPLATQIEQKERQQTQAQLEEIKEVLYGFTFNQNSVFSKNRLPCPDCRDNTGNCATMTANDGEEDTGTFGGIDTCATEIGNLPWVTLGVRETDAWGQRFTYRVTDDFADNTDGAFIPAATCTTTTLDVSFALCSDGDITILDDDGGTNVATGVPAIVISHGKNWSLTDTGDTNAATYPDEDENYDDGRTGDTAKSFVYHDYVTSDTDPFDDLMIWISPHVLRTKMLNAGILP